MDQICFVLMPFGQKRDEGGSLIDFDLAYSQIISPAIEDCQLLALRADEEASSGIIHRDMFERLILCQFAIVDISVLNANVYYELGVRHALRKSATVLISSGSLDPPFDIAPMRISRYSLENGVPLNPEEDRSKLAEVLRLSREKLSVDSPVFQLLDIPSPDISRIQTDRFRERASYDETVRKRLAQARRKGKDAVIEIIESLEDPGAGILTDAMLSLRATEAWSELVRFIEELPPEIYQASMFQEQRSLALARLGRYEEALDILLDLLRERGGTSERYGILGGVYKRRWQEDPDSALGKSSLQESLQAYRSGFLLDWRDAYPGINFLTLAFISDQPDLEIEQLVEFAIKQRLDGDPDFWDFAASTELAALQNNGALPPIARALSYMREPWEGESVANNLVLIEKERNKKGLDPVLWLEESVRWLRERAARLRDDPVL